jgi:hypothetical protein
MIILGFIKVFELFSIFELNVRVIVWRIKSLSLLDSFVRDVLVFLQPDYLAWSIFCL